MFLSRKRAKKKSKHRYSTYLLVFSLLLVTFAAAVGLDSSDLDDICDQNDHILYRYLGNWSCGYLGNIIEFHNITTINNRTILNATILNVTDNAYFQQNVSILQNLSVDGLIYGQLAYWNSSQYFDQGLNKTSAVSFNNVTTDRIYANTTDENYINLFTDGNGGLGFSVSDQLLLELTTDRIFYYEDLLSGTNGTFDLGAADYRWNNIYYAGTLIGDQATATANTPAVEVYDLGDVTSGTGTISITAGDNTITGSGTSFTTELEVGRRVEFQGNPEILTILSINSNTEAIATTDASLTHGAEPFKYWDSTLHISTTGEIYTGGKADHGDSTGIRWAAPNSNPAGIYRMYSPLASGNHRFDHNGAALQNIWEYVRSDDSLRIGSTLGMGKGQVIKGFDDVNTGTFQYYGDTGQDYWIFNDQVLFTSDTLPDVTDTHSLGNGTKKWKDLYLSGNISNGTHSNSINNILVASQPWNYSQYFNQNNGLNTSSNVTFDDLNVTDYLQTRKFKTFSLSPNYGTPGASTSAADTSFSVYLNSTTSDIAVRLDNSTNFYLDGQILVIKWIAGSNRAWIWVAGDDTLNDVKQNFTFSHIGETIWLQFQERNGDNEPNNWHIISHSNNTRAFNESFNYTIPGNWTFNDTIVFAGRNNTLGNGSTTFNSTAGLGFPLIHTAVQEGRVSYWEISGTDTALDVMSKGYMYIKPTFTGSTSSLKGVQILNFDVTNSMDAKGTGNIFSRILVGNVARSGTYDSTSNTEATEMLRLTNTDSMSYNNTGGASRTIIRAFMVSGSFSGNTGTNTIYNRGLHMDGSSGYLRLVSGGSQTLNHYTIDDNLNYGLIEAGGTINHTYYGLYFRPQGSSMDKQAAVFAESGGVILASDSVAGSYNGGNLILGASEDVRIGYNSRELYINSSDTNFTGDVEINGDLTWNQKDWGQMTYHNDTDALVVDITDNSRYFPITGMNNTYCKLCTSNTSHFSIKVTGMYRIAASISFGGQASQEYQMDVLVNDQEIEYCEMHRMMGTGGDVGNGGINCLYELTSGDIVALGVQDEAAPATDADIYTIHFNIERID